MSANTEALLGRAPKALLGRPLAATRRACDVLARLGVLQLASEERGGELWGESAPGQGSTFFFTLGERPR